MTLQSLGNLGEFISGLAVVVSLIYLALQVRQNTHSLRTENYARALERLAAMQSQLSENVDLTRIFAKGVADPSQLTPRERIQFTWSLYESFGAFEFMFHAARSRTLPDEVWERWAVALGWWVTHPGVRKWWESRPTPFTQSFTAFVEETLRNNPSDAAAAQRWLDFIVANDSQPTGSSTAG